MAQFSQTPVIEEGIDSIVSEQEKKERIRKALEIHMLNNREAHMTPPDKTPYSLKQENSEQGDEIEKEEKQKSIEQQRLEQQLQWQTSDFKIPVAPVRTCPCCTQFLQNTFHMSDKQANEFVGGATSDTIGYGSNAASESYGNSGPSGEYNGNSSLGNYSSSNTNPKQEDEEKYFANKTGYMP